MKKLLIVLALVLAVSVIFVACNKEENETPVTEAPATDAPATDAPATDAPATDAPATEKPTEAPTTEAPTEAPTTEEPTEAPTNEQPTEAPTEDTTTEEPTEETTTEAPTEDTTTEAPTEDTTTEEPTEDTTTEEPTEDTTTEAPEEEVIPYIGVISDINGLGPNGKKFSITNAYTQNTPHTTNPVTYYPPAIEGAWDYTCRRLSVNGWAMLEGGQGDMVWSDDYGATWKTITDVKFSDQTVNMDGFAAIAGIKNWNEFDMNFSLTIDLSGYEDDEYVTIWIGRKNADGKAVAIFKFGEIMIGDEIYVPELDPVCGNVSLADTKTPVQVVSFDWLVDSRVSLEQATPESNRLSVGVVGDTVVNIGNQLKWKTGDRVVQLYESDVTGSHFFQIEGWVQLAEFGRDYELAINLVRNGEVVWSKNTTELPFGNGTNYKNTVVFFKYCDSGFRSDISTFNGGKPCAFYQARLYAAAGDGIQNGDSVHLTIKDKATGTTYCFNQFTIKVVPDGTDISVNLG